MNESQFDSIFSCFTGAGVGVPPNQEYDKKQLDDDFEFLQQDIEIERRKFLTNETDNAKNDTSVFEKKPNSSTQQKQTTQQGTNTSSSTSGSRYGNNTPYNTAGYYDRTYNNQQVKPKIDWDDRARRYSSEEMVKAAAKIIRKSYNKKSGDIFDAQAEAENNRRMKEKAVENLYNNSKGIEGKSSFKLTALKMLMLASSAVIETSFKLSNNKEDDNK